MSSSCYGFWYMTDIQQRFVSLFWSFPSHHGGRLAVLPFFQPVIYHSKSEFFSKWLAFVLHMKAQVGAQECWRFCGMKECPCGIKLGQSLTDAFILYVIFDWSVLYGDNPQLRNTFCSKSLLKFGTWTWSIFFFFKIMLQLIVRSFRLFTQLF